MAHTQHKPTLRVLDILQSLASTEDEGLTLTEIATQIQVSKSTIVPILHTLRDHKFIEQKNDGRYILGINMFLIGSASQKNITVLNIFKAEMKKIVAQTVEVCQLGVLVDGDVLYLAKEDSPEPIRLVSFVGKRLPAYCTAIGKALLSDYTYKELSELYPDPLRPLTEKTCTDLKKLYEEYTQSKQDGYFKEEGECSLDLNCFALPIRYNNKNIAAISVSIPSFRLTEEKKESTIHALLLAQKDLEHNLSTLGISDNHLLENSFITTL